MRRILKSLGLLFAGLIALVVLAGLGIYLYTNSRINQTYEFEVQPVTIPTDEAALAQGEHVAIIGEKFSGGPIPGVPSDWPEATNLTPTGPLASWSEDDFITTLRTGVDPTGHELNPEYMPWPAIGQMTDDELKALWLYLDSLPPLITGEG